MQKHALASRHEMLASLWAQTPLSPEALSQVKLEGCEHEAQSSFQVAGLAQTSIAASALAAAEFWRLRGGKAQTVSVDSRHALMEFWSENYLKLNGEHAGEIRDPITSLFQTSDGWVRLHANFPHHRAGLLDLLQCSHSAEAVRAALSKWKAEDFEAEATRRGLCASALRSFEEWDRHPHAPALAGLPLISLEKVGDAPPRIPLPAERPLSGIRVLDLTRIISGPVCGRTLAVHGADVLRVTAGHLPAIPALDMDTGRGKKSCSIDLTGEDGRVALERLVEDADVFLQSYRPGALAGRGFGWQDVVRMRPGVIHASLSAYGEDGPWGGKRGFDSLVQTATGFNDAEVKAFSASQPRPLPVQALDHATGYLLATGIIAALHLRARVGGSWRVQACLARTGLWLRSLGRLQHPGQPLPSADHAASWCEDRNTAFGRMSYIAHSAQMAATPPRWELPSAPLDSSPASWW